MPKPSSNLGLRSRLNVRVLLGALVLVVLLAGAGLAAYLTRDSRTAAKPPAPPSATTPASPTAHSSAVPSATSKPPATGVLPVPPRTSDPIAFGKAAAVALWSYDTRAYSQPELVAALHGWMTVEKKYADIASVDAIVPSRVLWREMAANSQYATASAAEGHFPASFTQALQADPGAITAAYVYAVTVTGHQQIVWAGAPHGGSEARGITLAVQCRPATSCSLVGVLPNVAP
jgi:hypothetical protein